MKFSLPRIGVAALVAISLAACSGQSMVPSQSPLSSAPDARTASLTFTSSMSADALTPDAKSPCDIKGFWYFKGSCVLGAITAAGGKLPLKAYKGITVTLAVPKSNAAKGTDFLVGDGTSSTDITGTFQGTKFINFGKVPCVSITTFKTVKCVGTAFLYTLVANASKATVVLKSLPGATLLSAKFPGSKSCSAAQIAFTSSGVPGGWFLLPGSGKPAKGSVTIPGYAAKPFSMAANSFTVLAFTCQ
jgi:hypothetical protein